MIIRLRKLFAVKGYGLFIICMLLVGSGISITAPYLSLYCTEILGMSTSTFGIFMAVNSLAGVVVNSLIAKHSDRGLNRKSIIIFAMVSSAVGYASYLMFHNYLVLIIAVSLFSGLGAPSMPQIYAYAQESVNESESPDRTFAMSALRSLFSLGFLIGPLGGTLILSAAGYRGLFLSTSVIFLTIAVLVVIFLRKRQVQVGRKQTGPGTSTSVSWFKNRQIRQPLIAFVLLFLVNAADGITTPLFMVNVLHGTHTDVGLVVSICAGLEIPIMLILGALAKRISNHNLLIYGCFVAVAFYTVMALSSHPWMVISVQLLRATMVAVIMGNGLSYFTDMMPDSPGMATTFYSNASTMGWLLGNLGGGLIAQVAGFRNVYWVCLLLVIVSFCILQTTRPKRDTVVPAESVQSV